MGILQYPQEIHQNLEGTSWTPCLNFPLLEGSEPNFLGGNLDTIGGKDCRNKFEVERSS